MHRMHRVSDAVHWFMSELTSRVVADSGVPSDRFHLGKLILQSLKDAPEYVSQIDGSCNASETNASVLERSIRCATAFRNTGLQCGDVMVLMAPNHLDLTIPLYAALYLGVIVSPVDRNLLPSELKTTYSISKPKMIFCHDDKVEDVKLALDQLDAEARVITFDKGVCTFVDFLDIFGADWSIEDFRANDFDTEEAISFLVATSGTTGLPKAVAITHKNIAVTGPYWWSTATNFPSPTRSALIGSPLQWLTAIYHFIFSPIFRYTRIQSSLPLTQEHAYFLINTYKPTYSIMSPTFMTTLVKSSDRKTCDFTCFETIMLGGSAVPPELLTVMREISPNTTVCDAYGMSELSSVGFHSSPQPMGSCGTPLGCFQYRLVDIETLEDITEPNVKGELWMKGPGIFKEYFNNPEATKETFAEDRWFRTGDIFYRDENWNFFFVDRFKLLLKYKSHHISPVEVESVIRQHPGVFDVAVTGIPDPECGDLAVACVVKKEDYDITADEIRRLVRESLTDSKQLRGGVLFVDSIPMTATTKVHRRKLREMVLKMERE